MPLAVAYTSEPRVMNGVGSTRIHVPETIRDWPRTQEQMKKYQLSFVRVCIQWACVSLFGLILPRGVC